MKFRKINKNVLNPKIFNQWVIDNIDDYTHRYDVFYGGGGSGKSYGATQKVVLKAVLNTRKILVVRKVATTIRDSIYSLVKSVLVSGGFWFKENKSNMTITLDNGSVFLFKGMDDPEKIKSITDITDILVEEATELTIEDFTQLDIRLRHNTAKYQQITLMFNPVSKVNWCYKRWFEKGTPDKAKIVHTTYRDNKFLPTEYIETLERLVETNPSYYKIYCLGEFATLDKLVFPQAKTVEFDYREISKQEGVVSVFGLDFGYVNDPTAFTCALVDTRNKEIWIYDEHYQKAMLNDEIAKMIEDKGYAKERIIADSAEQKSIAEIKKLGIRKLKPAKKGKDSVMNGIQYLQQYKIYVHNRCINVKMEFDNYTWEKDKNTGEYINRPIDKYNHLIDSLRYSMEAIRYAGATI